MPKILRRNPGLREKIEKQNLVSGEGADSITPERVFTILANRRYLVDILYSDPLHHAVITADPSRH